MTSNLAKNLSHLCQGRSVADVCRLLEINRQQFNKYLSGQHVPSRRNLGRICEFFSIGVKDLYREPTVFAEIINPMHNGLIRDISGLRRMREFVSMTAMQSPALVDYLGHYDRYQYTSLYTGMILRSSLRIYKLKETICYSYIERFPDIDRPEKTAYVFKYHGICVWHGDRIFMIDVDASHKTDMTFSVLVPVTRNAKRFLYGMMMGIAPTFYREPFSTKIVLEFKGESVNNRQHVRQSTVVSADDETLPSEVMNYLGRFSNTETILRSR